MSETTTPTPIESAAPFKAEVFAEDLAIDKNNLNEAFVTQASLFAHYAQAHARMLQLDGRAKLLLEIAEAQLDKSLRDEATTAGVKWTETQLKQSIVRSPSYIKAALAANETKANLALAAAAVESFKQRRDMLIQIGASDRQEHKGDIFALGKVSRDDLAAELRRRMATPQAAAA